MTNDEMDSLDRLLDEALARYSNPQPLAGLEQRVLHRVRAQGAPRRFSPGAWLPAFAAVALAILLAVPFVPHHRPALPHPAVLQRALPAPGVNAALVGTHARARKRRSPNRHMGRPLPLTKEEQALLALVTTDPGEARAVFADLQRQSTEPIQLEAIKIEPLRSPDENTK